MLNQLTQSSSPFVPPPIPNLFRTAPHSHQVQPGFQVPHIVQGSGLHTASPPTLDHRPSPLVSAWDLVPPSMDGSPAPPGSRISSSSSGLSIAPRHSCTTPSAWSFPQHQLQDQWHDHDQRQSLSVLPSPSVSSLPSLPPTARALVLDSASAGAERATATACALAPSPSAVAAVAPSLSAHAFPSLVVAMAPSGQLRPSPPNLSNSHCLSALIPASTGSPFPRDPTFVYGGASASSSQLAPRGPAGTAGAVSSQRARDVGFIAAGASTTHVPFAILSPSQPLSFPSIPSAPTSSATSEHLDRAVLSPLSPSDVTVAARLSALVVSSSPAAPSVASSASPPSARLTAPFRMASTALTPTVTTVTQQRNPLRFGAALFERFIELAAPSLPITIPASTSSSDPCLPVTAPAPSSRLSSLPLSFSSSSFSSSFVPATMSPASSSLPPVSTASATLAPASLPSVSLAPSLPPLPTATGTTKAVAVTSTPSSTPALSPSLIPSPSQLCTSVSDPLRPPPSVSAGTAAAAVATTVYTPAPAPALMAAAATASFRGIPTAVEAEFAAADATCSNSLSTSVTAESNSALTSTKSPSVPSQAPIPMALPTSLASPADVSSSEYNALSSSSSSPSFSHVAVSPSDAAPPSLPAHAYASASSPAAASAPPFSHLSPGTLEYLAMDIGDSSFSLCDRNSHSGVSFRRPFFSSPSPSPSPPSPPFPGVSSPSAPLPTLPVASGAVSFLPGALELYRELVELRRVLHSVFGELTTQLRAKEALQQQYELLFQRLDELIRGSTRICAPLSPAESQSQSQTPLSSHRLAMLGPTRLPTHIHTFADAAATPFADAFASGTGESSSSVSAQESRLTALTWRVRELEDERRLCLSVLAADSSSLLEPLRECVVLNAEALRQRQVELERARLRERHLSEEREALRAEMAAALARVVQEQERSQRLHREERATLTAALQTTVTELCQENASLRLLVTSLGGTLPPPSQPHPRPPPVSGVVELAPEKLGQSQTPVHSEESAFLGHARTQTQTQTQAPTVGRVVTYSSMDLLGSRSQSQSQPHFALASTASRVLVTTPTSVTQTGSSSVGSAPRAALLSWPPSAPLASAPSTISAPNPSDVAVAAPARLAPPNASPFAPYQHSLLSHTHPTR